MNSPYPNPNPNPLFFDTEKNSYFSIYKLGDTEDKHIEEKYSVAKFNSLSLSQTEVYAGKCFAPKIIHLLGGGVVH